MDDQWQAELLSTWPPFAPDIDIPWESPCRLHCPDKVAKVLGPELKNPPDDYNPEQDPYFDRFGGHKAFKAFISSHSVLRRSIDVRKLLPSETLLVPRNTVQISDSRVRKAVKPIRNALD